jgi:PAS domain S-box-containing protein
MDVRDLILDTADGVLGLDRDQRIVLWNRGAEALLGYTAQEVLGKPCCEVLCGRDDAGLPACSRDCRDLMMTLREEPAHAHDLLVRTKDGREAWVSVSTLLVRSVHRDLCVLIHVFHDVGRRKEREQFFDQLLASVAKLAVHRGPNPPALPPPLSRPVNLTRRERDVLRLLTMGASTQTIAEQLGISPATARNHIHRILVTLRVHSRLEAVTLALRNGLI